MNVEIKLVIADDHEVFREGLKVMLNRRPNIIVQGEAENGKELLMLVEKHQPDVVLTDIKMPVMDGVEATRQIIAKYPNISVIGLSMYDEDDLIVEMMEAGAMGYLIKNASKEQIIEAIEAVYLGKKYYCSTTSNKLLAILAKSRFDAASKKDKPVFSDKEKEIIQLIYQQKTAKEMANKVFLSYRTIEGIKQKIMEKMGVTNNVGVAIYAMKNHLV